MGHGFEHSSPYEAPSGPMEEMGVDLNAASENGDDEEEDAAQATNYDDAAAAAATPEANAPAAIVATVERKDGREYTFDEADGLRVLLPKRRNDSEPPLGGVFEAGDQFADFPIHADVPQRDNPDGIRAADGCAISPVEPVPGGRWSQD
jgi:hypothetical protein